MLLILGCICPKLLCAGTTEETKNIILHGEVLTKDDCGFADGNAAVSTLLHKLTQDKGQEKPVILTSVSCNESNHQGFCPPKIEPVCLVRAVNTFCLAFEASETALKDNEYKDPTASANWAHKGGKTSDWEDMDNENTADLRSSVPLQGKWLWEHSILKEPIPISKNDLELIFQSTRKVELCKRGLSGAFIVEMQGDDECKKEYLTSDYPPSLVVVEKNAYSFDLHKSKTLHQLWKEDQGEVQEEEEEEPGH
eukprot:TRINITY_DN60261_c0_g1_i1.p1 TRINITY_DN60261_c0_g1~~TRINITY_DN60261_c0_g1_i1.p1  ORF type:complete len:252 (+),score=22.44 TRINITY_DN60261_c0_g1_i1:183-938(+)